MLWAYHRAVGVHINETGHNNVVWAIHDIRHVQIFLLCFLDRKYVDNITFNVIKYD